MSKRHSEQFKQEAAATILSNKVKPVKALTQSLGVCSTTIDHPSQHARTHK
jgi:transposase-like protein